MSCRTNCCKTFLLVLLAPAVLAVPAFAQTCLQDRYNQFVGQTGACTSTPSSNTLGCTANDVSISVIPASSINIISGGTNGPPSCFQGGNVTFTADYDILTTANAANAGGRDNVGLYLATLPICGSVPAGQPCNPGVHFGPGGKKINAAICGQCADNIISPRTNPGGSTHYCVDNSGTICGSDNYHEDDTGVFVDGLSTLPDNCGDTSSTDSSSTFGVGHEGVTFLETLFCGGQTCTTSTGGTGLLLNYCTSWQTPGSAIACHSNPGTGVGSWAYPFDPNTGKPEAVPGTTSKCNCSTVCLPITPITVTATIAKACNTSITGTAPDFTKSPPTPNNCDEGAEGLDPATYTVQITPSVQSGGATVDQICDTAYGTVVDDNLMVNGARVFPACAAGTTGQSITGTSCVAGFNITTATYTCTFTAAAIGELTSVSDQVSASLHATQNASSTTTTANSNQVTVFSSDAPSTATVTKSFIANEAACVTVRYGVVVSNTSGFDETLSLSGLNDNSFASITSVHDNVLGTTCGVASGSVGLGTFVGICTAGTCTSGNIGAACTTNAGCNVNGGGLLPVTLGVAGSGSSDYTCKFDAQFCGPITTIPNGSGGTCSGISHTNTVSATLTQEDTGTGASLTETDHGVTVDECISGTGVPN